MLLEGSDEHGQPFSDADVIANGQMVFTNAMLYGGPAVSFLLYGRLKYPEARERVLAEIDGDQSATVNLRAPSLDDVFFALTGDSSSSAAIASKIKEEA